MKINVQLTEGELLHLQSVLRLKIQKVRRKHESYGRNQRRQRRLLVRRNKRDSGFRQQA